MKEYKIRVYTGRIETKYGVDIASIVGDPMVPRDQSDIIDELMNKLDYTENEDDGCDYPGCWDNTCGAYFDYDGYIDFTIPESIIERILKGE